MGSEMCIRDRGEGLRKLHGTGNDQFPGAEPKLAIAKAVHLLLHGCVSDASRREWDLQRGVHHAEWCIFRPGGSQVAVTLCECSNAVAEGTVMLRPTFNACSCAGVNVTVWS